jgi:uncharacterized protein YecE (DUF72 family)
MTATKSHARAWIGASGWNYADWRGKFYPEDLRKADWLSHFAGAFDTVEVNNTFYKLADDHTIEHWAEQTPSRFRFAVKMWRGVSHYKKLKDAGDHLRRFFGPVSTLPARRRGPILVQLPKNQGRDVDKLDRFLDTLREITGNSRWKVAFEFRHADWLCDEVYRVLDRHRAAICLHDMNDQAPTDEPNDASFVYLRRHGTSGEHYHGGYSEAQIRRDAKHIAGWLKQGRTVFAYYNNDVGGHAVEDARRLRETLESITP